jgi:cold shock CspA family protein
VLFDTADAEDKHDLFKSNKGLGFITEEGDPRLSFKDCYMIDSRLDED